MILAVVIIAVTVGLIVAAGFLLDREEPGEPVGPEPCDACGETIEGDRCKLVQVFEDADGAGTAMSATFHPKCCPIIDPEHHHAGSGQRIP